MKIFGSKVHCVTPNTHTDYSSVIASDSVNHDPSQVVAENENFYNSGEESEAAWIVIRP